MPSLTSLDLIVRDVPRAVDFFHGVVGLAVLQNFDRFAELAGGNTRLFLSPDALVPVANASGVILHFAEENLSAAAQRAAGFGAAVLKGPLKTDWGTESLLVQGPEGVVIDFYRLLSIEA